MNILADTERHFAEYCGGFLFITERYGGKEYLVRLLNSRGQCVTRGQFLAGVKTHGADHTCDVFKKLAIGESK